MKTQETVKWHQHPRTGLGHIIVDDKSLCGLRLRIWDNKEMHWENPKWRDRSTVRLYRCQNCLRALAVTK